MQSTRRKFLGRAAAVAVWAQMPLLGMARTLPASKGKSESEASDPLAGATVETFKAWIGTPFKASLNGRAIGTLTLIAAAELEAPAGKPSSGSLPGRMVAKPATAQAKVPVATPVVSSFALRFSSPGAPLAQETYTLTHDWFGTFPLLLVPSGLRNTPATCSAVFSSLQ